MVMFVHCCRVSFPFQTLRAVFTQSQSMNQIQSMVQAYQQNFKDPTILGNFMCVGSHCSRPGCARC